MPSGWWVLVLLGALAVSGVWRGCGDPCYNSNQCNDALCSKCTANYPTLGVCVSGDTCNASCVLDSDCERLRYCYSCRDKKCQPGRLYPHQCGPCVVDSNCDNTSTCNTCLVDTTTKGGRRCGAGCGGKCSNNYDCGYGSTCSHCDTETKICTKGAMCGARCGINADCDQGGLCRTCIDFVCGVPCNASCTQSSECNAPVTGCGICLSGQCSPGVECGSRCIYDRDCSGTSCGSCVNNICVKGSQCGSSCSGPSECSGQCPGCTNGVCTLPQCGTMCGSNGDCIHGDNCTACTSGVCARPTCGSMCNTAADCGLADQGCRRCSNGKCSPPKCGSDCNTDTDCAYAGSCTVCSDHQCTYKLPENCEEHSTCEPGNDNQCPNTTCSRCDPFTATCRIGGPCGAACIVSTHCNQLSACKYCVDICMDEGSFLNHMDPSERNVPVEVLRHRRDARMLRLSQSPRKATTATTTVP